MQAGPSISHWKWFKQPDVTVKEGRILKGNKDIPYFPGEVKIQLLNAIQRVRDEKTALEFVREWGFLGFESAVDFLEERQNKYHGAVSFTYATKQAENPEVDLTRQEISEIELKVAKHFGNVIPGIEEGSWWVRHPQAHYAVFSDVILPKKEEISGIIHFARRVRHLSEVKLMLRRYTNDEIDYYEVQKWMEKPEEGWYFQDRKEVWRSWYYLKEYSIDVYEFVLRGILHENIMDFTRNSSRGVWVRIHTYFYDYFSDYGFGSPEYQGQNFPMIMFDGLFRFIDYILLVDQAVSPERCQDYKCSQLFFPSRKGQRYCPPLPWENRSRCENRHGRELRRPGKKKEGKV